MYVLLITVGLLIALILFALSFGIARGLSGMTPRTTHQYK